MHPILPLMLITLTCLLSSISHAAKPGFANPKLVEEVMKGKRTEARVSWWGFDAKDSTEFLQSAINSKVPKLIIDRQATAWVTRPLTGVSNQQIVFARGTELVAKKGDFKGKDECLISYQDCENVTLRGERKDRGKSAHIRMNKADYQSSAYEKSEWRHGLAFYACRNVLIQDLTIEETGGDAIYLGAAFEKGPNENVVIRRVDCNNNHRQGISVITARNLMIDDCLLRNTKGTAPEAGIDFEPNSPKEFLVNCVVRKCVSEGNSGSGYLIVPQQMNISSEPVSITIKDCVSRKNRQHAIHVVGNPKDAVGGSLRVNRFQSSDDSMAGLSVQFNHNALRIELLNSAFLCSALGDTFFAPFYLQGVGSENPPAGVISFHRVTVKDELDRPVIRVRGHKGSGQEDITGGITLELKMRTERIKVDKALLRKYVEQRPDWQ
ncbi:MAG: right-handed parallel beta-helix repeat-containing protein [Armatimonadota bacterium]